MSTAKKVIDDLFNSTGQDASEETFELFKEALSHPKALEALDALSPLLKTSFAETYAKANEYERQAILPPNSPLAKDETFAKVVFEVIRDSNAAIEPNGLEKLFAKADAELQVWGLASMCFDGLTLLEHSKPSPESFDQLLDLLLGHHNVGTWDHRLNYNAPGDTCAVVLTGYARCLDHGETIPERFSPLIQRAMKSSQKRTQELLVEVSEHLSSDTREELRADSSPWYIPRS